MTPEQRVLYDPQFLKSVWALEQNVNTAEWRNSVATTMLDQYYANTDGYPNAYTLEKLADWILGTDDTILSESQIKTRLVKELSNGDLSS